MDNRDTPLTITATTCRRRNLGNLDRVATAWPYRNDQGGFTVQLLAVPLSGTNCVPAL